MSAELAGLVLSFLGAMIAALAQYPWSKEAVVAEAGFGRMGHGSDAMSNWESKPARAIRRQRTAQAIGLGIMSIGFLVQLVALL